MALARLVSVELVGCAAVSEGLAGSAVASGESEGAVSAVDSALVDSALRALAALLRGSAASDLGALPLESDSVWDKPALVQLGPWQDGARAWPAPLPVPLAGNPDSKASSKVRCASVQTRPPMR